MINEALKEITYKGRTFYYQVKSQEGSVCDWYYTNFYHTNNKVKLVRKYIFFGPWIEEVDNDFAFKVEENIEDCKFTKDDLHRWLDEKYKFLDRCQEIKNGDIV